MTTQEVFTALRVKGFCQVSTDIDDNLPETDIKVFSSCGHYIGDELTSLGCEASVEFENNSTWIEYKLNGVSIIGHRDLNETSADNPNCYFPK